MATDTLNVFSSIRAFPDQAQQVLTDLAGFQVPPTYSTVQNVVISGMGGSALGGRIVASLERQVLKVPILVSTEYHLPNLVNDKTLVIASSYSGNTEETLESLQEAISRNAKVLILASGGKLAQFAAEKKLPAYIFSPKYNPCGQPRLALMYNVVGLLRILAVCDLIHDVQDLSTLPTFLTSRQQSSHDYQTFGESLKNQLPVIVASEHLKGAGIALRNQINENAKTFAAFYDLPELNHHLMEGLTYPQSNSQNLHFVLVESEKYHPRIKRRYELTKQLLSKQQIAHSSLKVSAESNIFETMELIQAGAYIAYYLSQIQDVDPGPIPWVDWFKDEMAK